MALYEIYLEAQPGPALHAGLPQLTLSRAWLARSWSRPGMASAPKRICTAYVTAG